MRRLLGAIWQDSHVCVRFSAPPAVIDSILSLGYTPTTWGAIADEMSVSSACESSFSPAWSPRTVANKQCYIRNLGGTKPVPEAHYLVVDGDSGTVYAVGGGQANQRFYADAQGR